ncbi:MAG: dockerin type I domain-containing protein [Pirellulales bacterium]
MKPLLVALSAIIFLATARAAVAVELVWNDAVGIWALVDNRDAPVFLQHTYETRGVAVDEGHGRLLWSDILPLGALIPGGEIREAGLEGGGKVEVLAGGLTSPAGVAIDSLHGNIYWTDLGDNLTPSTVYMAGRDGGDPRPIIRAEWLSQIEGIAVDPLGGKLYFSYVNPLIDSLYNGGIARAELDGSNVEGVIGGLGKPNGVAVDPLGNGLYWADAHKLSPGGGDGEIAAADLNGDNRRMILGGLELPYGVALDLRRRDIYWTDSETGKIQRTGMSGVLPYFEDVINGLENPTAIAIASITSFPMPGDANGDGRVDRADVAIVAANFGRTGAEVDWSLGDFNNDHRITLADLATLQQHLTSGERTSLSPASVPEPSAWALLSVAAIYLVACRRRPQAQL